MRPHQAAECRLLLVTRNLPPLIGGMERLNRHMVIELQRGGQVAVIGPAGCTAALPPGTDVSEVPARPVWRFFVGALLGAVRVARRFRPVVVLAGSGLAAPFAWLAAKLANARTVVYVHGLDLIAPHPIYRWCWLPFIRRADLCIANSRNSARLAMGIGVPESRIAIVPPGVDLPSQDALPNDFRARFDFGDRPLLLSVGRLIARKGLLEFVERALPRIAALVPDVCLVVLGDELPDLLHGNSSGLGERIRERATELGLTQNLRFIGQQDDATLSMAYRAADVHVFPVRDVPGDVEGFGMVAVEAAAHGLPTVAYAVGGVPDAVAEGLSGCLVAPDDAASFAQAVLQLLRTDGAMRESCIGFAAQFAWPHFGAALLDQIQRLTRAA